MLWKYLLGLWMAAVIVAAHLLPIPQVKGLGETARIIFFHVPVAWVALVAFTIAAINSIRFLHGRNMEFDYRSYAASQLGLFFCLLATITGSIWAKVTWGSFWNWDPRESSIFVLLLIYGAYFALRSAIEDESRRAALSAVYTIIAFVTVPFLVFVIPRVYFSLHPAPLVNVHGRLEMDIRMLLVFLASLFGFTMLLFWMYQLQLTITRQELREE